MQLSEHTYGTWNTASSFWGPLDITHYCGWYVDLCFVWDACADGVSNDNMLIDFVTTRYMCGVAVEDASISTVKARY